jgi:drug/metabolite transporter (DMT)-like permease
LDAFDGEPPAWSAGARKPDLSAATTLERARWISFACLAASTSLVGSYVGLSKLLVAVFPVFLLATLRFGIAGVLMLPWMRRTPAQAPLDAHTRWLLFAEAFLGNFLFSIALLTGLQHASAVVAGVIMAGIPAAVALLSRIFLGEKIAPGVLAGILLGVAGIMLVALQKGGGGDTTPLGALLLLVAVFCEACYVVIGKRLTAKLEPKRISAIINLWGLVLVAPLGLWQALRFDFSAPSLPIWGLMGFYAAAASMVTVWLWMTGLRHVPASQAGVFMVFLPVSTGAVGLLLGESMSFTLVLAYVLALAGVLLATRQSSHGTQEDAHPPPHPPVRRSGAGAEAAGQRRRPWQ